MKEYTFKAQYTDEIERLEVLERVTKVLMSMLEDRPADKYNIQCWKEHNHYFIAATYNFA